MREAGKQFHTFIPIYKIFKFLYEYKNEYKFLHRTKSEYM